MTRRALPLVVGVAVLLCLSCSDDKGHNPCDTGGVIHAVSLRLPAHVRLTSGTPQEITVIAEQRVKDSIETVDSCGTLIIRLKEGATLSDYELTVDLTLLELRNISCFSPGFIETTNRFSTQALNVAVARADSVILDVDVFLLNTVLSAEGPMKLTGEADIHSTVLSGVGSISAFDLETVTTNITLSGVGGAEVSVSTALNVVLSGSGSVYYKGDPTVNATITGSGVVEKVD